MLDKGLLIGGVFLLCLLLSVFLSSGAIVNCLQTQRYTNCSAYGCFIVKNASGVGRIVMDGNGAVDIAGILSQSYNFYGASLGATYVFIRNSSGVVAVLARSGNIAIGGTLTENQSTACTPPANSFIIKARNGSCAIYISPAGNMWTKGVFCYNASIT